MKSMRIVGIIILIVLWGLVLSVPLAYQLFLHNVKSTGSGSIKNTEQKICYLTFDDGPSYNTPKVLDILEEYDVKATFFLIGSEIGEEDREILLRMKADGHAIGLHSNVHDFNKIYTSIEKCVEDYESERQLLSEQYEIDTNIFRFPGGSACTYMYGQREAYIDAMQQKGFVCFDWHVSGEDSVGNPTVYSIQKNITEHVFNYQRPIILLHDSGIADMTVDALPGIIEGMRSQGYEFGTLEEREEYVFRHKTDK